MSCVKRIPPPAATCHVRRCFHARQVQYPSAAAASAAMKYERPRLSVFHSVGMET